MPCLGCLVLTHFSAVTFSSSCHRPRRFLSETPSKTAQRVVLVWMFSKAPGRGLLIWSRRESSGARLSSMTRDFCPCAAALRIFDVSLLCDEKSCGESCSNFSICLYQRVILLRCLWVWDLVVWHVSGEHLNMSSSETSDNICSARRILDDSLPPEYMDGLSQIE